MYVCTCVYLNLCLNLLCWGVIKAAQHSIASYNQLGFLCECTCVCGVLSAITFFCFSSLCKAAEIYQGQDKTSDDSLFHVPRGKKNKPAASLSHLPVAASPCTAYYCQQPQCQLSLL